MARLWTAIALVATLAASTHAADLPLVLSATTDAGTYDLDDEIVLTLEFTNVGTTPVTITEAIEGTYRVRVTRDGGRVPHERFLVQFSEDPFADQVAKLRTLQPGESIGLRHDVAGATPAGAEILEVRLSRKRFHRARSSLLTTPGDYTVRLEYRYRGEDGGLPNVFRRRLRAAVSFTLTGPP